MCLPIQYALTYPERVSSKRVQTHLAGIGSLTFEEPDLEKFPALTLARRAAQTGGTMPAVMNAANEVAVASFCRGRVGFDGISATVERVMNAHTPVLHPSLDEILAADIWAREEANQ
jgi:1-deoxy-D-xylulose-5-phosphate reductoisomerase